MEKSKAYQKQTTPTNSEFGCVISTEKFQNILHEVQSITEAKKEMYFTKKHCLLFPSSAAKKHDCVSFTLSAIQQSAYYLQVDSEVTLVTNLMCIQRQIHFSLWKFYC